MKVVTLAVGDQFQITATATTRVEYSIEHEGNIDIELCDALEQLTLEVKDLRAKLAKLEGENRKLDGDLIKTKMDLFQYKLDALQ